MKNIVSLIALAFIIGSCANIVPPAGGPRDTTPPKVVKEKSTANFQTQFKKQRIVLTFDEWVKLDSVFQQVFVSPPTNERPEVTLHRNSVWIDFDNNEVLKPNTTYTINMGNSVKDITEGNAAKNLRFVFSTGDKLDSLFVLGVVKDALKGEPVENVLLMLYDNLNDTVVKRVKPLYFGQTDKEGRVKIENIKAGKYKMFALKDADANYLFNQETENIGFPEQFITLPDTSRDSIRITLFEPKRTLRLLTKETSQYGAIKLGFTREPKPGEASITYDNNGQTVVIERGKDSTSVFYNAVNDNPWNLYVKEDTGHIDTIRIRAKKGDFLKKRKLQSTLGRTGTSPQHPLHPFKMVFNAVIESIDTSKISLLDSLKSPVAYALHRDSLHPREVLLETKWVEDMRYQLEMLPGAFMDIYGLKSDTISRRIVAQNLKDFGGIILKIGNLDSTQSYIIQLLRDDGKVEKELVTKGVSRYEHTVATLPPGAYSVKIIEDMNGNGEWDTGDYEGHRQAERIWLFKLVDPLRADWEVEAPYDLER